MNINENKVHFFNLDILRFVAVFMVVVFHGHHAYSGWFGPPLFLASSDNPKKLSSFGEIADKFVLNLDLGVDLFFLISGFLITYLLLEEKKKFDKINIKNFYIRRALRIWPLYFLIIALTPLLCKLSEDPQPDYWWTALFMNNFFTIKNLAGQFPYVHFWSVCIEEHFYLVWPLLITFIPVKKLPVVFTVVIAASILFRFYVFLYSPNEYMHINYNTLSKMDVLAIGGWIGYIHSQSPIQIKLHKAVRILFYIVFIGALCIDRSHSMDSPFLASFKKYFYVLGFVFLFSNYMFNGSALFNFKTKNVFHYLGKISYGIYMYHNLFFGFIARKIMYPNGYSNFYLFVGIYLILVLTLSVISYELYEKHFLKLKDKFAAIKTTR